MFRQKIGDPFVLFETVPLPSCTLPTLAARRGGVVFEPMRESYALVSELGLPNMKSE